MPPLARVKSLAKYWLILGFLCFVPLTLECAEFCRLSLQALLKKRLELRDASKVPDHSNPRPFEPEVVFRNAGLNPDKMRFEVNYLVGSRPHSLEGLPWVTGGMGGVACLPDSFSLELHYEVPPGGAARFVRRGSADGNPSFIYPNLADRLRNKGVGTFIYIVGARMARDAYGKNLESSTEQLSPGKRLWERLRQNGYAQSVGVKVSAFKENVVDSDLFDPAMTFFLDRAVFK